LVRRKIHQLNAGGEIVEFGNKYVGGDLGKSYSSLFIFPLGIELFFYNEDIELNFTIWPLQLTFGIGKNRSLFN
jgi:hypothetical protein|tara:strand:- start:263 stop:484 length:222 start_codon:yes stop_codon:yes gene_type:complete